MNPLQIWRCAIRCKVARGVHKVKPLQIWRCAHYIGEPFTKVAGAVVSIGFALSPHLPHPLLPSLTLL